MCRQGCYHVRQRVRENKQTEWVICKGGEVNKRINKHHLAVRDDRYRVAGFCR